MAKRLTKAGIKFVALLLVVTAFVSCGKKTALQAPPSVDSQTLQIEGEEANGSENTAPVKEDKPFFLDPLL